MPELPEVESARRHAARLGTGKAITHAEFLDDTKIFTGPSTPAEYADALRGATLRHVGRKGKQLWLELGRGNKVSGVMMMHFGMTGSWVWLGEDVPQYRRFTVDAANWPPRFWKFHLEFADGTKMAFTDPRRFGKAALLPSLDALAPHLDKLGFDPLLDMVPQLHFDALLARRKRPIKAVLLDQAFCAGIGNWVADEVLYQSRVHPEAVASELSDAQRARLRGAVQQVIAEAVEADADYRHFPESWLFHQRWITGKDRAGVKCGGKPVAWSEVGGRTTAFVPSVQLKTDGKRGPRDPPAPMSQDVMVQAERSVKKEIKETPSASNAKVKSKAKAKATAKEVQPSLKSAPKRSAATGAAAVVAKVSRPRRSMRTATLALSMLGALL